MAMVPLRRSVFSLVATLLLLSTPAVSLPEFMLSDTVVPEQHTDELIQITPPSIKQPTRGLSDLIQASIKQPAHHADLIQKPVKLRTVHHKPKSYILSNNGSNTSHAPQQLASSISWNTTLAEKHASIVKHLVKLCASNSLPAAMCTHVKDATVLNILNKGLANLLNATVVSADKTSGFTWRAILPVGSAQFQLNGTLAFNKNTTHLGVLAAGQERRVVNRYLKFDNFTMVFNLALKNKTLLQASFSATAALSLGFGDLTRGRIVIEQHNASTGYHVKGTLLLPPVKLSNGFRLHGGSYDLSMSKAKDGAINIDVLFHAEATASVSQAKTHIPMMVRGLYSRSLDSTQMRLDGSMKDGAVTQILGYTFLQMRNLKFNGTLSKGRMHARIDGDLCVGSQRACLKWKPAHNNLITRGMLEYQSGPTVGHHCPRPHNFSQPHFPAVSYTHLTLPTKRIV
eukprot:TRINITY_DN8010_c0_g1_i2.p1 TRINITY_DN8010_c0_g1~~TRINITY_DN8010_c0_g1_i2.p1  ORF type:complete len:456 (-),score=90.11 TRINITY_DN8010_c0_g1_i2:134-1501(-)